MEKMSWSWILMNTHTHTTTTTFVQQQIQCPVDLSQVDLYPFETETRTTWKWTMCEQKHMCMHIAHCCGARRSHSGTNHLPCWNTRLYKEIENDMKLSEEKKGSEKKEEEEESNSYWQVVVVVDHIVYGQYVENPGHPQVLAEDQDNQIKINIIVHSVSSHRQQYCCIQSTNHLHHPQEQDGCYATPWFQWRTTDRTLRIAL